MVGAFASCFPASASLTRSALLRLTGARTRWAAASSGLFVVPVLLFGGALLGFIPQASFAGVLFVVAYTMVDTRAVLRLWRASPQTRVLLLVTFVATLALPIQWAVLLGAGLGLLIFLNESSAPRLRLLRPRDGRLVLVRPGDDVDVAVLEVSGSLHYAAVPPFVEAAEAMMPRAPKLVVLDLSHAHQIRFSALLAFERLAEELRRDGAELRLAGVDGDVHELLRRSGSPLPATPAEGEPGLSVRRCLGLGGAGENPAVR
jgi:SulP family sulfate permease